MFLGVALLVIIELLVYRIIGAMPSLLAESLWQVVSDKP
jgi:hypothetical protein